MFSLLVQGLTKQKYDGTHTFERSIWWYLEVLQHLCLVLSFWCWRVSNIPVNMPDPIWKHFGCSQLWPACSQNQARSYMQDLTFCIQFGFFLPKKAQIILCKTGPDLIWMACSGFGWMRLVQEASGCATCVFFFILILMTFTLLCPLSPKNSFSTLSIQVNGIMRYKRRHHHQHQESLGLVLAEHKLAHCQFPTCGFGCILPQMVWIMLCKTSLVLADCQVLVKWILSGSKLVCNNHQATSGQWFQADQDLMWLCMFTGIVTDNVFVFVCVRVCVCTRMHTLFIFYLPIFLASINSSSHNDICK